MKWHQILNPKVIEIMCKTTPFGQWHGLYLTFVTPVQVMDGGDNLNQTPLLFVCHHCHVWNVKISRFIRSNVLVHHIVNELLALFM